MQTKKISKNLEAWELLLCVHSCGGLTQACIELDLDTGCGSRMIRCLEKEIGTPLLDHTRRPLALTKEGDALLPNVRKLLTLHAELTAGTEKADSRFKIRLAIPINIERSGTLAFVNRFSEEHPDYQIEIIAEADEHDILTRRCDFAILPYRPRHPELFSAYAGSAYSCGLASKVYLEEHGTPEKVSDLTRHRLIRRTGCLPLMWESLENGAVRYRMPWREEHAAGDYLQCLSKLLNHEGLCFDVSIAPVAKEIENGTLRPVLHGWHRPNWHLHLAALRRSLKNDKFRLFLNFLLEAEQKNIRQRQSKYRQMLGWMPENLSG